MAVRLPKVIQEGLKELKVILAKAETAGDIELARSIRTCQAQLEHVWAQYAARIKEAGTEELTNRLLDVFERVVDEDAS